jgi:hypothetical protein
VFRLLLALPLALSIPQPAAAQTSTAARLEPSTARVAVLPMALYTAQANVREPSDSAKAALGTRVLLTRLGELVGRRLLSPDSVARVTMSPDARARAGDQACGVIVACARFVGEQLGAGWVVMAKVSKTSNLIWLFTGQLIRVSTGEIVLDDSTELKGDPENMVRAGTRIFAERVARTIRQGGVTNDFPAVE